ncbi:unnamed protein product [Ectocarpus sp. 12 AP-2014]
MSLASIVEVRAAGAAGNGCFATSTPGGGLIRAGTAVLQGARPMVWALKDEHEGRNCRRCLQPPHFSPRLVPEATPQGGTSPPHPRSCAKCLRSVLCSRCITAADTAEVGGDGGGCSHGSLECDALVRLSALQREQPGLASSLLGGSTVYLRLLLQLLAMRSRELGTNSTAGSAAARAADVTVYLSDMDDLEDHLDDLLDGGEMEARMGNTIGAARLVAPAAWKANQDVCSEFLGKLYCNSMTIGKAGFSAPLAGRGYWSGIRGCLYSDFGVGLYPAGAMFNHSCRPNCSWRTDGSGELCVVACEDVPAGSQLFISYVDILQPWPVRQDLLRCHFFFECACQRCCRSPPVPPRRAVRSASCKTGGNGGGTADPCGGGGCSSGTINGDSRHREEMVSGAWVCPKRACCGNGRVLPPLSTAGRGGAAGGEAQLGGTQLGARRHGGGAQQARCRCVDCGGVAGEAYFDRWTELLRAKQAAADDDLAGGRVREGRRQLVDLQVLCERRLSPQNSFSLGVHCRQSLAAAVDRDWPTTIAHAERALDCMRKIASEIEGRGGGGGLPAAAIDRGTCVGEESGDEIRGGRGSDDNRGGGRVSKRRRGGGDERDGGSFTAAVVSSECPLLATAIWEAILVEVLDRVLPLAGRHCETETELHRARVAFAERVVGVLGLRRSSLVTLPGKS